MQKRWEEYLVASAIGLMTATGALTLGYRPGLFGDYLQRAELATYDRWVQMRPLLPRSDDIVLVCIDEASLQALPKWPWPRGYHAQVINALARAGAKIIAFDVVFSGVTSDEAGEALKEEHDLAFEPPPSRDDEQLAQAITKAGNVILAARVAEESLAGEDAKVAYEIADFPHPLFEDAAHAIGMANTPKDVDNVVRRAWLGVEHQEEFYPTLAVQVAADSLSMTVDELRQRISGAVNLRALDLETDSILIDFRGPEDKAFRHIPYWQILWGQADLSKLAGKIVFIGATAQILQDIYYYPLTTGADDEDAGGQIPGVAVHASITDALRRGAFIRPLGRPWLYLFGLITAGLVALGTVRLRPLPALGAMVASALLVTIAVSAAAFLTARLWLPPVVWSVGLLSSYSLTVVYLEFTSERLRRRLRQAWERRVSPEVLQVILDNPSLASVRGRRTSATVLFADMQDFTRLCHECPPEQVVETLNEYFNAATETIRKHEGTLHKFIGDGIMAVFGDPLPQKDHARRALRTAWDLVHSVANRCVKNPTGTTYVRVGIHSGPVVAGDIGCEEFLEYTVIGDTVSTASRLEELNKEYGTQIMLTAETLAAAGEHGIQVRSLGEATVRGRSEPLRIYTVEAIGEHEGPTDASVPD